jgi:hypothetical protein
MGSWRGLLGRVNILGLVNGFTKELIVFASLDIIFSSLQKYFL